MDTFSVLVMLALSACIVTVLVVLFRWGFKAEDRMGITEKGRPTVEMLEASMAEVLNRQGKSVFTAREVAALRTAINDHAEEPARLWWHEVCDIHRIATGNVYKVQDSISSALGTLDTLCTQAQASLTDTPYQNDTGKLEPDSTLLERMRAEGMARPWKGHETPEQFFARVAEAAANGGAIWAKTAALFASDLQDAPAPMPTPSQENRASDAMAPCPAPSYEPTQTTWEPPACAPAPSYGSPSSSPTPDFGGSSTDSWN